MKKIGIFILTAITAVVFSGCGAPGGNTGNTSNTNTNSAKTTGAAPTADSLLALEKQANEAYLKGDGKFFETFLNDKFNMTDGGTRVDKAMAVKMISGVKCDVKTWSLEDPKMTMIDADVYGLTYKANYDGSCTWEGKTQKLPAASRTATVWVRSGDKWQPVFHGENPIVDLKNPPPPPPATDAKKEEPKKDEAKPGDKSASNSNTAAPAATAPVKSPNTDAIVAIEKSGWEAWMKKDAKKLEEITAKDLSIVTWDGQWLNRADTLKYWVEMPCENVKSVDVKNGSGTTLSPTAEMLTFTGWSDGTCYGQKNGDQDGMSIYVKEGGAWKLAFSFTAAPKSAM
jgi:hypothetical protein